MRLIRQDQGLQQSARAAMLGEGQWEAGAPKRGVLWVV